MYKCNCSCSPVSIPPPPMLKKSHTKSDLLVLPSLLLTYIVSIDTLNNSPPHSQHFLYPNTLYDSRGFNNLTTLFRPIFNNLKCLTTYCF